MKNNFSIFIICIGIVASVFYQNWYKSKALKKLYTLKCNHCTEQFMSLLDSKYIKFTFNEFTRQFMKLNYWIEIDNDEEVKKLLHHFQNLKMSDDNKVALYSRLFGYYVVKKENEKATHIKDKLLPLLESKKDDKSRLLLGEINQVSSIYIEKDTSLLPLMTNTLNNIEDNKTRTILCSRIAKLYQYMNNSEKVNEYLLKAIEYTDNKIEKESLKKLMDNPSLLD